MAVDQSNATNGVSETVGNVMEEDERAIEAIRGTIFVRECECLLHHGSEGLGNQERNQRKKSRNAHN